MLRLLWKEWHEQNWKLAFGILLLGFLTVIGLRARIVADLAMLQCVGFVGITLLPVMASAGSIAAERGEGTFQSIRALPISSLTILKAKVIAGVLLCIIPIAAAEAISMLMAGGREMPVYSMFGFFNGCMISSVIFFIWMLALTAQVPSEARAGLLGAGILIFWGIATGGLTSGALPSYVVALSPFAFFFLPNALNSLAIVLGAQGLMIVLLLLWTVRTISRSGEAHP